MLVYLSCNLERELESTKQATYVRAVKPTLDDIPNPTAAVAHPSALSTHQYD